MLAALRVVLQLTGLESSGTDHVKRVTGLPGDRVFLVVWPPAQLREVPIPATFAQRGLAAPPRRGMTPLPMAVGLAGMLPLVWARRRQTAHVPSERR